MALNLCTSLLLLSGSGASSFVSPDTEPRSPKVFQELMPLRLGSLELLLFSPVARHISHCLAERNPNPFHLVKNNAVTARAESISGLLRLHCELRLIALRIELGEMEEVPLSLLLIGIILTPADPLLQKAVAWSSHAAFGTGNALAEGGRSENYEVLFLAHSCRSAKGDFCTGKTTQSHGPKPTHLWVKRLSPSGASRCVNLLPWLYVQFCALKLQLGPQDSQVWRHLGHGLCISTDNDKTP